MDPIHTMAQLRGYLSQMVRDEGGPIKPHETMDYARHRAGRIELAKQLLERTPSTTSADDARTGKTVEVPSAFDH